MKKSLSETAKTSRADTLSKFDVNTNGLTANGVFGLPFTEAESQIVLLPVPWELTVSYGGGTANGPAAIITASQQLDLYEPLHPFGYKVGIAMTEVPQGLARISTEKRPIVKAYIESLSANQPTIEVLTDINATSQLMVDAVKARCQELLSEGKFVGLVGGDHSTPLGYMQALAEIHDAYSIIQIDAHADLRNAYEGFTYSHASIMYNALKIPQVSKIVQVGVRDISHEEIDCIHALEGRVNLFHDHDMKKAAFLNKSWNDVTDLIINQLSDKVYISFDIDGLQPWLCPNTGTPVPDGLDLEQVFFLLEKIVATGKQIIGFDLCEVSPGAEGEWDANVGARVLYKLCMLAVRSIGTIG